MTTSVPLSPLDSTLALVTRARAGDRGALEAIADRYQAALTRFARGRLPAVARGLVDTDDLVQVAVVRTLDRLESFDHTFSGSLLAYLRRVVLNQIRDEIRRAQRRSNAEGASRQPPAYAPDPLEVLIGKEAIERYDAALSGLPGDQQQAFMMRIEMGYSYNEIAEALGRPSAEAARMLLRRAIRALAHALRRTAAP